MMRVSTSMVMVANNWFQKFWVFEMLKNFIIKSFEVNLVVMHTQISS